MAILLNDKPATGGPGIEPRWARSDKDGIGTARSTRSRVWFTVSKGIVNEVYYPTIDLPQIRDLQFLATDGETFFRGERQMENTTELLGPHALGYRITNKDLANRYQIVKEVIADPQQSSVLIHTRMEGDTEVLAKLRLFTLLAPHLRVGGKGNNGNVVNTNRGNVLSANKEGNWLVLGASAPFLRTSCAYAGTTDGWQDLDQDFHMDWDFNCALDGNIALTAELDLKSSLEFTLVLAFGDSMHHALVTLEQSLGTSFADHRTHFLAQWNQSSGKLTSGQKAVTSDSGRLFGVSRSVILAHEDKTYEGALIASLSIPWGEVMGDGDTGGYHLVWTRDMCHSATGLLATGDTDVPLRALIYLACTQKEDGGFYQNFWINGEPHWTGIQLDEVAMPIMLAWRLHQAKGLRAFDPYPMVLKAAGYLIQNGPVTPQERWEENSGFSPSTLAAHIAALICAAAFARERGHKDTAQYLEEYADFLEAHIDQWTVTTEGTLVEGIPRHFIRLCPADPSDVCPNENANLGELRLPNTPPGAQAFFPAKDVVDAGFLELVRYGIRKAGDQLIEDSLKVIDATLKIDTPFGSCWRRYNHDGYGQKADGGAYQGFGYGHAWPVLTGERAHYELAASRDVRPLIKAMECFAGATGLLPEQVWALPSLLQAHMEFGRPTGGAMPLVWAHAEYLQLVRSTADKRVFSMISEVANRYSSRSNRASMEIWKYNRQVREISSKTILRVQTDSAFRLHWTTDEWNETQETLSRSIETGHEYVDIAVESTQKAPIRFTFFWTGAGHWEQRDFEVIVSSRD